MTRDVRRLNPAAGAGPANCLNAGLIHAAVRRRVSELGVTISTLYQRLLQEIGPGTLRSGSEIYYPLAVRELYQPFFDDAGLVHLEKMTNLKILSLVRTEVSMGAYRKLRKSLPKCWVNFP